MRSQLLRLACTTIQGVIHVLPIAAPASDSQTVPWGPSTHSLIDDMEGGRLKNNSKKYANGRFHKTDFSVGDRGATLNLRERTMEIDETAGLDSITWILERSSMLADGNNGADCQNSDPASHREGEAKKVLVVLTKKSTAAARTGRLRA